MTFEVRVRGMAGRMQGLPSKAQLAICFLDLFGLWSLRLFVEDGEFCDLPILRQFRLIFADPSISVEPSLPLFSRNAAPQCCNYMLNREGGGSKLSKTTL